MLHLTKSSEVLLEFARQRRMVTVDNIECAGQELSLLCLVLVWRESTLSQVVLELQGKKERHKHAACSSIKHKPCHLRCLKPYNSALQPYSSEQQLNHLLVHTDDPVATQRA